MMKDLQKAKQLFWDYACSHFHLDREGMRSRYIELGGADEHEAKWRQEYIEYWSERLSVDDLTAVNQLWHAHAHEALPRLMALTAAGDGYAKLWFSLAIADLCREAGVPRAVRKEAREMASAVWSDLVANPQSISPTHKKAIRPSMHALDARTPEEYVHNYAERKLNEMRH